MSENAGGTTSGQLTLFAGDFLASRTVWPGSEEARQMTVTSGRNIAGLLQNSGPVGSLLRTCLVSERLSSTACYLTWKVWTTPQGRLLFRLAPSTPRTGVSGSSLLPTLKSSEAWAGVRGPNAQGGLGLTEAVGGQLSLVFAEWLMGFPTDWTDLDHSETP